MRSLKKELKESLDWRSFFTSSSSLAGSIGGNELVWWEGGWSSSGGVLHHLELAGGVVAGVHVEVRASARAHGNLGACGLARVLVGGVREEGAGEGPLVQRGVRRSQDRQCHGLARAGGRAGLVQLAGVQLVQLQLGGHGGGAIMRDLLGESINRLLN